jgi:integrase
LALRAWLKTRGGDTGAVFTQLNGGRPTELPLNTNRIALIVQRAVESIGLDPTEYAAHSLRAGYVTEALAGGANELVVARQTGHRSLGSLRRYFRPEDPFRVCAATGL